MNSIHRILGITAFALMLQACDSDNVTTFTPPPPGPPAMATYDVTVTNLTNAQPLSPIAVVGHNVDFSVFSVGMPASAELEQLAAQR